MPKPCRADGHGDAPTPGCRLCELAATRADYAAHWGEPAPAGAKPAPATPACPHLGEATGGTVACASCRGLAEMPVFACGKYGLTVTGDRRPKSDEIRACRWCPDRPR